MVGISDDPTSSVQEVRSHVAEGCDLFLACVILGGIVLPIFLKNFSAKQQIRAAATSHHLSGQSNMNFHRAALGDKADVVHGQSPDSLWTTVDGTQIIH